MRYHGLVNTAGDFTLFCSFAQAFIELLTLLATVSFKTIIFKTLKKKDKTKVPVLTTRGVVI